MAKDDKIDDVGLGLQDFLAGGSTKDEPQETPKQEVETKQDLPSGNKPEAVEVQAKEPPKAETAKPAGLDKDAKGKAKAAPVEAQVPASPNWDDETNPWKKKAEEFDKRYRDTHSNWNQLHQQNQELNRRLEILSKKLDGTYDPQRDEPQAPDPQQVQFWGEVRGKAEASLAAAFRTHGQENVMKSLDRYAQIFGQDRFVQERILHSPDPVQAAMDAVKGYEFFNQYGSDPSTILTKFRAEFETNELPKIREAETKRIMEELAAKQKEPKGLSTVQGSSGAMDKQIAKDNAGRHKPLSDVFGH